MTHAEIRAFVLASAAEDQVGDEPVYARGLHDEGKMWRIGSLRFWKSDEFARQRAANHSTHPFPSYRRASLQWDLLPDLHFEVEPFTTKDGRRAFAILLCSEKDPQGSFATFALDESEAKSIAFLVNSEMDVTRKIAIETFRASGGDPATVAARRAPSLDERLAMLAPILGNPDD